MPGPNTPYTQLSADQVIQQVFDESQDKLRVDASVSVTEIQGEVSVEIDAADGDNIALSNADGSKKVTVTTVSGKEALDVNVVNNVSGGGLSTPLVQNVLTTANTEQVLAIGSSVKKFALRVRGVATLKLSYQAGQSGTQYYTISAGTSYWEDNLELSGTLNLYYQTTNNTVLEVITWT